LEEFRVRSVRSLMSLELKKSQELEKYEVRRGGSLRSQELEEL
jgi:hypothetical protein